MPRGDGTGPAGQGPMTGRAAGFCAGYDVPGFANFVTGRGFGGRGRGGGGWGRRNWFHATGLTGWQRAAQGWPVYGGPGMGFTPYTGPFAPVMTEQHEVAMLRSQAVHLEDLLEGIKKCIEELEARASEGK